MVRWEIRHLALFRKFWGGDAADPKFKSGGCAQLHGAETLSQVGDRRDKIGGKVMYATRNKTVASNLISIVKMAN